MHRGTVTLIVTLLFVATIHSAHGVRCYMCTSVTDSDCENMSSSSQQSFECTLDRMTQWQDKIKQNVIFARITDFFRVDAASHDSHRFNHGFACAKIILNVSVPNQQKMQYNQHPERGVIVRTCQLIKTETTDPCIVLNRKLNDQMLGNMEYCSQCTRDSCNSATSLFSGISYTLLLFLGILLNFIFYHRA